jgi:hypothetical protein
MPWSRVSGTVLVILAFVMSLCGCAAVDGPLGAPVVAPGWEHVAFGGGDADFVAAIDLRAFRADPVFGPLLTQLARNEEMGVLLRASQIDVVATVERGEPTTWLAVVHGVDGPPTRSDVGSGARDIVAVPGAWILGEGAAFDRVRARPGLALRAVAMPGHALVASTAQGRAFQRSREPLLADTTEGLREATVEMLGGEHWQFVAQCRYVDASSARHAAAAARVLLLAAASSNDVVSMMARALMKVDFDVSGEIVSMRVTISDDLRDVLQTYVERAVAASR